MVEDVSAERRVDRENYADKANKLPRLGVGGVAAGPLVLDDTLGICQESVDGLGFRLQLGWVGAMFATLAEAT